MCFCKICKTTGNSAMELNDLKLFVRAVELATGSVVARERDVAVSQISRAMRELEARYGASL